MLKIDNISFSYKGGDKVLKDVSLELEDGTVTCLLGPNGTGKTTLLKVLLGFLKNESGSVKWDGMELTNLSARERARILAYVPQFSGLTFPYSVEEVVLMGRLAHLKAGGAPGRKDREIALSSLERLSLLSLKNKLFHQLSGGEKQMVLIARALSQQSKVLVMDEPTASLDFSNQVKTMKVIKNLGEEGYTVLMTSHSPDQAFLVADNVALLKDGSVFASGTPECVITSSTLSSLYGTETAVVECNINENREIKVCIPVL